MTPASGDIPASAVVAALAGLAGAGRFEKADSQQVALALLVPAHFPLVRQTHRTLWSR